MMFLLAASVQAATIEFGWGQPDLVTGNQIFYGWKAWQSTSQNGTYSQFGNDIIWDGTVRTEYVSPAIPITPPAGQETTYYFKFDAWNKAGTSTPLNSDFSNVVTATFDLKAPTVPVMTPPLPATTTLDSIPIAGTKEANSSILIGGVEKVPLNASTTWSVTMPLVLGTNLFAIMSRDAAGNESGTVVVSVVRNAVIDPPPAPTNLRAVVKP